MLVVGQIGYDDFSPIYLTIPMLFLGVAADATCPRWATGQEFVLIMVVTSYGRSEIRTSMAVRSKPAQLGLYYAVMVEDRHFARRAARRVPISF